MIINKSSQLPDRLTVVKDLNLTASMRDGTVLKADVYRPDTHRKYPVLLARTPYDKLLDQHVEQARKLAELGYLVVVQDVRGRYASDGEFRPGFFSAYHHDTEDGHDTVEWAASLPWSTGKVGTFGNSYVGWTQWELAHSRPSHLTAMMPQGIAANLLDRELSGILRLGRVLWWSINSLAPDQRRKASSKWGPRTLEDAETLWAEGDRSKWLWYLPLMDIPDEVMFGIKPHFESWLKDRTTDHFRFLEKHSNIDVPALTITGWYDQQIGSIKHFTGMSKNGRTERAREGQRLIIGPWTHTGVDWVSRVGDINFGPEASRNYYDVANQWFSYWLKDEGLGIDNWPPIQIFVMGSNQWRAESEWPLARTVYQDFYLHSSGSANTTDGDGILSTEPPEYEPHDQYIYDPKDPVMTQYSTAGQQEPRNLRPLNGRHDILVYTTTTLEEPLEVTGPVVMELWAASSAPDTDFVVKLIDVWPDGSAYELCHGIVRARYRKSFTEPSLIRPYEVYHYTIQVNPTSNVFKQGHRLRVDISSSDFPNFDRNHNTGGNDYEEDTLLSAVQTIFHDKSRPSRVVLPIISKGAG